MSTRRSNAALRTAPRTSPKAQPLRVLLAVRDPAPLAAALEQDGHLVTEIRSGAQLLERLTTPLLYAKLHGRPELTILDPGLLEPRRRRILIELRRRGWSGPLVLLPAEGIHAGISARQFNATAVLPPPLDLEALRGVLEQLRP